MISAAGRPAEVTFASHRKEARVTYALRLRLLERLTEHNMDSAAPLTVANRSSPAHESRAGAAQRRAELLAEVEV